MTQADYRRPPRGSYSNGGYPSGGRSSGGNSSGTYPNGGYPDPGRPDPGLPGPGAPNPGSSPRARAVPVEPSPGGHFSRAPVRRWPRRMLIGMNVIVAVCLVGTASVYGYVRWREAQLNKVILPGLASAAGGSGSMNILLVGNNTRTGLDPTEAKQFGSAKDVGGARSDVTMIVHLDLSKGTASLLSIPRDLFVSLPPNSFAGKYGKIDSALNGTKGGKVSTSGPNNLINAIEDSLGIPINHYISVNFDGFQRTIDAIGGINLNFPTELRDVEAALKITKTGCQHLNGHTALAVVRARHLQYFQDGRWHDDPLSDLARIRRDHMFLRVFVSTARGQLTNPLRVNSLIGGLLSQVTVDSNLGLNSMLTLYRHMHHIDPNTVPELTLPITVVPNYHYAGGVYGDVDMAVEPLDHQVIDQWLGKPTPTADPASLSVQVVNISGVTRKANTTAQELASLGYQVTSVTSSQVPAPISETVVRYHPGSSSQALTVMRSLNGAVIMHADPTLSDGHVAIDLGSTASVATSASSSAADTTATTVPGRASVSTSTTLPTAGSQPPSSSVDQPEPFDPTPCPA